MLNHECSGQSAHLHMVVKACAAGYTIHRGPYMSAHVLLNLLDGFRKCDKMRGLSCILSLFHNEFNTFNNTAARI